MRQADPAQAREVVLGRPARLDGPAEEETAEDLDRQVRRRGARARVSVCVCVSVCV